MLEKRERGQLILLPQLSTDLTTRHECSICYITCYKLAFIWVGWWAGFLKGLLITFSVKLCSATATLD